MIGKVFLVGAGPGDPELLTRKAARILAAADVVLHDSLVSREVLALAGANAQRVDVGKRCGAKLLTQDELNSLLVDYAQKHAVVVRLKGGDPLIFGRAAEEIAALRHAGVPFEIVPGITAALSAAAAAQLSLTDRRMASQLLITTFSHGQQGGSLDWSTVTSTTTLAIYMPGSDYAEVAARLLDAGLAADTPCAVVSHATGADQQVRWTSIHNLFEEEKLPTPALLIVGRVAAQHDAKISEHVSVQVYSAGADPLATALGWRKN